MRKPLIVIIVTLSLVCTLKVHVNTIQMIKAMHVCVKGAERSLNSFNCYSCYSSRMSRKWYLWLLRNTAYRVLLFLLLLISKGSQVSNTMYCTLYTGPLAPARREGYLSLLSWGFSSSPPVSPRRQPFC